jgi:hypothetical protein
LSVALHHRHVDIHANGAYFVEFLTEIYGLEVKIGKNGVQNRNFLVIRSR